MEHIRPARAEDAWRIAEIFVTNYRMNFYRFFKNDEYYFGELNVADTAEEYAEGSEALAHTYVYDDGVIKGFIRVIGGLVEKLFVEPQFQSGGIGAKLLRFAVNEKGAENLWALEYNERGIAFYKRNGFRLTGDRIIEDEVVPLLKMSRSVREPEITLDIVEPDSACVPLLERINEEAFPACERATLDELFATNGDGNLEIIGIYADKEPVGLFAVRKFGLLRYLAYFAVSSELRGRGIGSKALDMLKERCAGNCLVTECEAPDESCENNALRLRRLGFYLRNGFAETGWYRFYDETEFEVVSCGEGFNKDEFDRFTEYLGTFVSDHIPKLYRRQENRQQPLDFIFIIGAPAVGKTTLAKELYQRLNGVYIEQNGVPEFMIPQDAADPGEYEESLCWENLLAQAEFFYGKGLRNILILDIDDVRTREIPQLFNGKRFVILRLYSSDFGQILSQMDKRRGGEGGLYDPDGARRLNEKMSRRALLPNEIKLDISGKTPRQVLDEALGAIEGFEPLTDYDYAAGDIHDYCSWVQSRGLK